MEKGSGKAPENIYRKKTMQERTFTIHRHYEPNKLSDKCLSDAYEILIRRMIERKKKESLNKKEVKKNDNSGLVCKSLITEASAEEYN